MITKTRNSQSAPKQLNNITSAKPGIDFGFLLTVIVLLALGLLMVFSSSYPYAYYRFSDGLYFIKRQMLWAGIGAIGMYFGYRIDYRVYKRHILAIMVTCFVLLLAVLVVGKSVNGAKRWLGVGGLTFQPSEFAKFALIMFFAAVLDNAKDKIKNFKYLFCILGISAIYFLLLIAEPHYSVCLIIAAAIFIVLIVAGAKFRHFLVFGIPVVPVVIWLAFNEPYRLKRLIAFVDPFADALGSGWQVIQSLYAIGSGGLFGLGFGNSRQKFLYVSEPQNDFIFSIICEELGLIGAIAILVLFGVLLWRGMKIAIAAPDTFGCLLVTGIMSLIGVQVVLNIAVVTSTIPTTGIPLPFFSAGGSTLLFLMTAMGIVLNVSKHNKQSI